MALIEHLGPPLGRRLVELYDAGYTTPGWYFWCESGTTLYGPYASEQEAKERCAEYARWLDEGGQSTSP